jgi:serine/threonine protein kinase
LLNYLERQRNKYQAEKASLSEEETRHIFYQIISGVSYAHNQHICHRDLKLENILLKDLTSNIIKIADFGLSGFYRPGALIKSNCGTLSFLAPEVFKGTANAGPPQDVWALGVILFALLCGRLPFEGLDLIGTKRPRDAVIKSRILKCQYKIDERVGPEAKDLVRRMLQVDPSERASVPELYNHVWLRSANAAHQSVDVSKYSSSSSNITKRADDASSSTSSSTSTSSSSSSGSSTSSSGSTNTSSNINSNSHTIGTTINTANDSSPYRIRGHSAYGTKTSTVCASNVLALALSSSEAIDPSNGSSSTSSSGKSTGRSSNSGGGVGIQSGTEELSDRERDYEDRSQSRSNSFYSSHLKDILHHGRVIAQTLFEGGGTIDESPKANLRMSISSSDLPSLGMRIIEMDPLSVAVGSSSLDSSLLCISPSVKLFPLNRRSVSGHKQSDDEDDESYHSHRPTTTSSLASSNSRRNSNLKASDVDQYSDCDDDSSVGSYKSQGRITHIRGSLTPTLRRKKELKKKNSFNDGVQDPPSSLKRETSTREFASNVHHPQPHRRGNNLPSGVHLAHSLTAAQHAFGTFDSTQAPQLDANYNSPNGGHGYNRREDASPLRTGQNTLPASPIVTPDYSGSRKSILRLTNTSGVASGGGSSSSGGGGAIGGNNSSNGGGGSGGGNAPTFLISNPSARSQSERELQSHRDSRESTGTWRRPSTTLGVMGTIGEMKQATTRTRSGSGV